MQTGGDRLTATQNGDGGWGWPLTGSSAPNTAAPIAMGLLSAYAATGDAGHLNAAIGAGGFVRDVSPPHSTGNGIFMHALSEVTGDAQYANDVKTELYDQLEAGTYTRGGTDYDTASFAALIGTARAGQGYANLALWDISLAAVGAHRLGADTTDWVTAIQNEINELDGSAYFDVVGLAGGVWALAEIGVDFDPTAGEHAAAGDLADLAAILGGYQIDDGGFTWNSGYTASGNDNETTQETAYAILALDAYDRVAYHDAIAGAGAWLVGSQLGTGGWANYAGGAENNEITGEALWGIQTVPAPGAAVLAMIGLGAATRLRRRFGRA